MVHKKYCITSLNLNNKIYVQTKTETRLTVELEQERFNFNFFIILFLNNKMLRHDFHWIGPKADSDYEL